ncbi:hypothetical protein [Moorena sp. SIO2C4]|uniref:hypothetical protein n=1 Tax=Moorena sp. SIO2C4 TaxID=2607824 RepID=UPI0013C8C559|nr:hypothetical protein [Moorena sp. SIO2C4]NES43984.1 hypothetical protein [Moorena sp. SIO2C4]
MINFSKQLGVVTTAIALTSATVGVLPAAAFQIIKHEFSGTLEFSDFLSLFPEPSPPTINYEGLVQYTNQGELLFWCLDLEGSSRLGGVERQCLFLSAAIDPISVFTTVGSDIITLEPLPYSPTIPFVPINPDPRPFPPRIPFTTFKATPDNWTIDVDFGRFMDLGGETFSWNRESGIRFTRGGFLPRSIVYVDPNPNFKETITNLPSNWVDVDPNPNFSETITSINKVPSNWLDSASVPKPASGLALYWVDPTSVPEPVSGLALLGVSALGAGSVLKRRDK